MPGDVSGGVSPVRLVQGLDLPRKPGQQVGIACRGDMLVSNCPRLMAALAVLSGPLRIGHRYTVLWFSAGFFDGFHDVALISLRSRIMHYVTVTKVCVCSKLPAKHQPQAAAGRHKGRVQAVQAWGWS
jgi:hypothetical protein